MLSTPSSAGILEVALLRGAVEEMPLGVAIVRDGVVLHANAALERVYGAEAGELDGCDFEHLFGAATARAVASTLEQARVFDQRVETRGLDGRPIIAEVRIERYRSAAGQGGFLLLRDVSLEAGALSRLVHELGGASFRVRVDGGVLEHVGGEVEALLGIEASACMLDPMALASLVGAPERERIADLYRRLVLGIEVSGTTEITIRRPNGRGVVLFLHATGRRDASGAVRHVDGVVVAKHETEGSSFDETRAGLVLAGSVLRESAYLHQLCTTGVRRIAVHARTGEAEMLSEIAQTAVDVGRWMAAAGALNRRVRRALEARAKEAPLIDVLENVRATLVTLLGDHAVVVDAARAGRVVLHVEHDMMALALTYLGLRAFRLAGSGALRFDARREGREAIVDIVGEPGTSLGIAEAEPDTGSLPQVPNPGDILAAFASTELVLARMGAVLEDEGIGVGVTRTRIRIAL